MSAVLQADDVEGMILQRMGICCHQWLFTQTFCGSMSWLLAMAWGDQAAAPTSFARQAGAQAWLQT